MFGEREMGVARLRAIGPFGPHSLDLFSFEQVVEIQALVPSTQRQAGALG